MNRLGEGFLNFLLPSLSSQHTADASCVCEYLTCRPSCFLAPDHLSANSFSKRGYQRQPCDESVLTLIPSISILNHTQLFNCPTAWSLSPSFSGDITVEGLDGERPLQTGEVVIIVVVLLMWAGE